jgi:hypothetical protein
MKIVLSKVQWEKIGKKAGWIKTSQVSQETLVNELKSDKEYHDDFYADSDRNKEILKNITISVNIVRKNYDYYLDLYQKYRTSFLNAITEEKKLLYKKRMDSTEKRIQETVDKIKSLEWIAKKHEEKGGVIYNAFRPGRK